MTRRSAWIGTASASPLLFADAGVAQPRIARRSAPAPRPGQERGSWRPARSLAPEGGRRVMSRLSPPHRACHRAGVAGHATPPPPAQRQACPVAAVAPSRPEVEANEARPVLGPVGGLGDVVEALADGDFESAFDFDSDHKPAVCLRAGVMTRPLSGRTRRTHVSTRSATCSQPGSRVMSWPMPSNSSARVL